MKNNVRYLGVLFIVSFFVLFFQHNSFAERVPKNNNRYKNCKTTDDTTWFVVLGSFSLKADAEKKQKEIEISCQVISTDDYSLLKPGLYCVVIPFYSREAVIQKSKELNEAGIKNYARKAGVKNLKRDDNQEHVYLTVLGKYVVIAEVKTKLSFDDRNHELLGLGKTPVDLLSEILPNELSFDTMDWKNKDFYDIKYIDSEPAKIIRFHYFSRILIETYRPPWCFQVENYGDCFTGNYSDTLVKEFIFKNQSHLIVGELDREVSEVVIDDRSYAPSFYSITDLPKSHFSIPKLLDTLLESIEIQTYYENVVSEFDKNGVAKWYENTLTSIHSKIFELEGDTLFFIDAQIIDSPCGGYIDMSFSCSFKIENGKLIKIGIQDVNFEDIIKFPQYDSPCILKFNHNSTLIDAIYGGFNLYLPFSFEDPWEC